MRNEYNQFTTHEGLCNLLFESLAAPGHPIRDLTETFYPIRASLFRGGSNYKRACMRISSWQPRPSFTDASLYQKNSVMTSKIEVDAA